jgi:assimilatory nitrate reductase catalytic subunit
MDFRHTHTTCPYCGCGQGAANVLTNPALDPVAKIPEFKVCAVKVEKLAA